VLFEAHESTVLSNGDKNWHHSLVTRTDRVARLRELLAGRERSTVRELASELGVSRRTVLRDLASLRDRGLPVEGEPGVGGGVRLLGDRGVTAVHLSFEELASLWVAASLARRGTALPWGGAARSALDKLLASLPRGRARELTALMRRVVIGPPATAAVAGGAGAPSGELLALLERAFRVGQAIAFDYRDRVGRASRRLVEPHGLLVQPPVWYVLAHDIAKGEPRMFRMDRIARPAAVRGHAFTPDARVVQVLTACLKGDEASNPNAARASSGLSLIAEGGQGP
jgi:predicted DNA-binding transcriptional regulator YafY